MSHLKRNHPAHRNLKTRKMNIILLLISAILSYAHLFISDNRAAWYCLVFERNFIILLISIAFYKTVRFKDSRLKQLLKINLIFWILRIFISEIDTILLFFGIDFQKEIFILAFIPILYLIINTYFTLKGVEKCKKKKKLG